MPDNAAAAELTGLIHYLFYDGLLDAATAQSALKASVQQGISLTTYLVRSEILSSQAILTCCAKHFGLTIFDLAHYDPAWLHDAIINLEFIHRYRVIPLNRDQHQLQLGITDPTDHATLAAVSFHTGLHIKPVLVSEIELDKIINTAYGSTLLDSTLESTLSKITPLDEKNSPEKPEHHDEPVIEFVNRLIQDAITKRASDIHIEPYADHCRIRFRCDGLLYEAATIPLHLTVRITSRLKIIAGLNIAERRLPQDGRIQIKKEFSKEAKVDIRINTCPTLFGEKIVLRLLDTKNITLDINALGFTETQKELFLNKLTQPQGLILVTGPTGSGKTVTLYSALHYLNQVTKNISSVEDPVEIELQGINQVNINPKIGLDFTPVLRAFLRQDPDIIMIGEIRDRETALIAIQAAQTGHLVLSTLHTNNAIETMNRLQSMGIVAYNLINALSLIVSQRLVRRLCRHCKCLDRLPVGSDHTLNGFAYRAVGCEHCHQGYQGQIGIFELIPITEKMSRLLLAKANTAHLLDQVRKENWALLWESGLEKVKNGLTSLAEITRVIRR